MRSRTHRPRTLPLLVAAVLTLATATACSPTPESIEPTSEPTGTPLFATDDEALAAATQAYAAYLAVTDEVLQSGGRETDQVKSVAEDSALDEILQDAEEFEQAGYRTTGSKIATSVVLQSYDSISRPEVVTVYVCENVAAVDLLDSSGLSIVSPTRPDATAFEVQIRVIDLGELRVVQRKLWDGDGICP
jgi:hypothetical protein